jgi:amino acid efflux transporter
MTHRPQHTDWPRPESPQRAPVSAAPPSGSVGLAQGTALHVAAVLGSGLLVLPGLAIGRAGPAALVALGALLLVSAPLALTFAALAERYPDAGGVATFTARAFGARASVVVGWWFYLGVPVGVPALALFAGSYVEDAAGGGATTVYLTAAALTSLAVATNAFGVSVSGRVQLGLTAVLLAGLLASVALAAPRSDAAHFTPFAPHGWGTTVPAALLLVWCFTGWEAVTHLAGEFRHPARDITRATVLALVIVAVVFLAVTVTLVAVLGPRAGTSKAPLADLLTATTGGASRALVAGLAVLVTLGTLNAYLAGLAKLGSALGRDGGAPAWLARGSAVGGVPRRSLAVTAVLSGGTLLVAMVCGTNGSTLVLICSAFQVAVYATGLAAALRLLRSRSAAWWSALLSLVLMSVLLLLSGRYLLAPLALAAAALARGLRRPGRAGEESPT